MTDNWIKFDTSTADVLSISPDEAIGKLVRFWCWKEQQYPGNVTMQIKTSIINHVVRHDGFGEAMLHAGFREVEALPAADIRARHMTKMRMRRYRKRKQARTSNK